MILRTFSSYKLYKKWLCIFLFSNPVSAILLWRPSRRKWTTRYAWHAGICWHTRPWWTRWSQRRPGQPREDWAPGTTWSKWNERGEGRTWDPGSCRPKGRPGGQRRQWISSTGFIHELEGVCLKKTGRQGFRRNLCKSRHFSPWRNLFYELPRKHNFFPFRIWWIISFFLFHAALYLHEEVHRHCSPCLLCW